MVICPVEADTFDLIDRLSAAETVEEICALLAGGFEKFGFTSFLITDLPPPSSGLESSVILNGWSQAWFDRYMQQGYYRFDPMAKKTRETTTPFFWSEVPVARSRAALEVMDEAASFGLRAGFSVPIFDASGAQSCVTMGGEQIDIPPRGRTALHIVSIFGHACARALQATHEAHDVRDDKLSSREREVLLWIANGKTDWEIGEILDISAQTVAVHVRNCCRKLQASTRTQAVVMAMKSGEIRP